MTRFVFCFGIVPILIFIQACTSDKSVEMNELINKDFEDGVAQYRFMSSLLSLDQFPKTFENGELKTSGSGWWCSGFYPGSLYYLYEQTGDQQLHEEAQRMLTILQPEEYNTTTHDLGFMMYCSFGNALRIDQNPAYRDVLITSARSFATRFDSLIGCIRSWDPAPWNAQWQYPVIIDNMMNLELLMWATQVTGDSSFYHIAVTHANTTMKNHFRPDFSSYHVVSYDTLTGAVEKKNTDQGYADESAWARGQSWGLYGYTMMYRFTRDERYLDHAKGIAGFLLNHPNLPADKVPYWDFDAPDIPNAPRDASAGAVIASALLELQSYVDEETAKSYVAVAETIIQTLSGPAYRAVPDTNGGFILKHSVGNMPDKTEVDVPLTYADYYFLEALKRYQEIKS